MLKPKGYVESWKDVVRDSWKVAVAPYVLWMMLSAENNDPKFRVASSSSEAGARAPSKIANVFLAITYPLMLLTHLFTIPFAMFAFVMSPVTAYVKHKGFFQQANETSAARRTDAVLPSEDYKQYDEENASYVEVGHYGSLWRKPTEPTQSREYDASNASSYYTY